MHSKNLFLNEKNENTKKKILFLDIDGVIQPYNNNEHFNHDMDKCIEYLCDKYKDDIYKTMDKYDVCACFYNWDDSAIGYIKKFLYERNYYIVLSTGWREYNNFEQMKALFRIYDLDDRIVGCIENGGKVRCIEKYLEDNKENIENYIIFDDQDFTLEFGERFILCYDYLKEYEYKQAVFLDRHFVFEKNTDDISVKTEEGSFLKFSGKEKNFENIKIFNGYFHSSVSNFDDFYYIALMKHIMKMFFNKYDAITTTLYDNIDNLFQKDNIGQTVDIDSSYAEHPLYKKIVSTKYRCNYFELFEKYGDDLFNV